MPLLIAGNWKMHGLGDQLGEIRAVAHYARAGAGINDVLLCVPATLIARAVEASAGGVSIGGEDCAVDDAGAATGDISAEMLKDAGARTVILGHSERRRDHQETDGIVAAKAAAAARAGLSVIVCIGETQAQHDAGTALQVCAAQLEASLPADRRLLAGSAIAYEPRWSIGTGRTPGLAAIAEVHQHIRQRLERVMPEHHRAIRILYGGSVTAENAEDILLLPDVGGVLVGGASLQSEDFNPILRIAAAAGHAKAGLHVSGLAPEQSEIWRAS